MKGYELNLIIGPKGQEKTLYQAENYNLKKLNISWKLFYYYK